MKLTPNGAFEHIKESVVQYLETQYRISSPAVFAQRGKILRKNATVAQQPFIEATPSFPSSRKLSEIEKQEEFIPDGLSELVRHGVPVDRFNLYTHQEQALLSAFGNKPNLLVATGTGSGKTEAFILPILSDILAEAKSWKSPHGNEQTGSYDAENNLWLHSRRHETRPSGLRAIILYPMNALVNDQLSRLRRILALNASPDWQRRNLNGNVIHFGMYTGLSQPAGSWGDEWRRAGYSEYVEKIEKDWENLREDLRATGFWPRPGSPEMVCRWDMQQAPPDIMVTNYSMLEYMLVRPLEHEIFETTRRRIADDHAARFTLVLDEAHTYTGARGTEVAHLVRRLKERLGIGPGSGKFRAIATTASLPNIDGADENLLDFMEDLVGEPRSRFTLIQLPRDLNKLPERVPSLKNLKAFQRFHKTFDMVDPWPAIERIASDLDLGLVDKTVEPQVALYRLLETNEDIKWIRQRTARNATLLENLSKECWQGVATSANIEDATAGVVSAGSFARPEQTTDIPPLLSVRLHVFFRGISGLWACLDPNCKVSDHEPSLPASPLGKLFTEPTPWCECGARVLEVFSCHHCGLLFVGGIPDSTTGSLWPWSDDLSGEKQDLNYYRIFGVESPHSSIAPEYRSTRTTLACHQSEPDARLTWEIEPNTDEGRLVSPYPKKCPRCQNFTGIAFGRREVVEPLRTKGPQSFSLIVEDGFRVQPRANRSDPPNYGRKALLFSDSRIEAAKLAGDLRNDHGRDLFRQLLYTALHSCENCMGKGTVITESAYIIGKVQEQNTETCGNCNGSGWFESPAPIDFKDLRKKILQIQFDKAINPTNDEVENFFKDLQEGDVEKMEQAALAFEVSLRRELSEQDFGLEPLGLGSWRVNLPDQTGAFPLLSEDETKVLLRLVARLLATENILLRASPASPWEWPKSVNKYEKLVIVRGFKGTDRSVPFNLSHYRKLGRYIIALSQALVRNKRIKPEEADSWVKSLDYPLWNALVNLKVLSWAGAKVGNQVPQGIKLDSFVLHPVGNTVFRCKSCSYIMSESVLGVCLRCGQDCESVEVAEIRNYYRRAVLLSRPGTSFDDPYPLRVTEHTGQIKGTEARDIERWFQDLFHDDQNPSDHRVDILSVTTTMEMGIDIGSLLCVGLRNIPPNVANYQQRAGRAGRRGSSIATVLGFAQQRSHDQYYFSRPPEIVTKPPRVPSLYLQNEIIARRHVRSLVLQDFFNKQKADVANRGLFGSWGTIKDFANKQLAEKIKTFTSRNSSVLEKRCESIVHESFRDVLKDWIGSISPEVQEVVQMQETNLDDDLFEYLINSGLLPSYAFPTDVVSLSVPQMKQLRWSGEGENTRFWTTSNETDGMQRDLKIALAEYAPGAEVIRGEFPKTYIYRSVGVYDAFDRNPNYKPAFGLFECLDCQSVDVVRLEGEIPDECKECKSLNTSLLPFITPPGFTVDQALPGKGVELYRGGGRERSGYVLPAKLLVGQTSFSGGEAHKPFAETLYSLVRVGDLVVCNKGPNPQFPGFLICPDCGRSLDPEDPMTHTYPADIPPHRGKKKGPRAGDVCPGKNFTNQVVLGHQFHSEVVLLGVDLPSDMDAPFFTPAGRSVWYSFGTLLANASALVLQVDPGELRVGVRPVKRTDNRIHGEVFLYDDVPGGAGYARAIRRNLEQILEKAIAAAASCSNPDCNGACYQCMFDYRNQSLHPILDRHLGGSVIRFLLKGEKPAVTIESARLAAARLENYARANWKILREQTVNNTLFPLVLQEKSGQKHGLWVIHPMSTRPTPTVIQGIISSSGIRPFVHTTFDLERRPFWVLNNIL